MPITMKLGQLLMARPALERLMTHRFSMFTSYQVAQLARQALDLATDYEQQHNDLVRKLGTPLDEQKSKIGIDEKSPNWSKFVAAVRELKNRDVTLPFNQLKLSDLQTARRPPVFCSKCGEPLTACAKCAEPLPASDEASEILVVDMMVLWPLIDNDLAA
jgi:hypothetical protein